MKKALLFLVLVLVAVTAFAQIEDWGRREWESWSEYDRATFVAGMMHKEENMRLVAEIYPLTKHVFQWLDRISIRRLTVGEVVDMISAWYKLHPEDGDMPIALVYEFIAIREQRGHGWR